VFVSTRAEAESLQALLAKSGISAVFYHAGLEPGERARWQREVTLGLIDVVIGTNALAMGLDVKDFRFCIHAGMTASPHEYAQEIGRAGRDGASASAYYLYDYADKHLRFDLICKPPALNEFTDAKARAQSAERDESVVVQQQDLVLASVQLLENTVDCRQLALDRFFGVAESSTPCGTCDNCVTPASGCPSKRRSLNGRTFG